MPLRRLTLFALAAVCGCQPAPVIKVGFIGGLSDHVTDLDVDARNGTELAVETLDARGGPRFELRLHDDRQAIEAAPAVVDAAADEGDAFAIGPMTSGLAMAMASEATKRRLVLISPTANSDELDGRDDYFFHVFPPAGRGADTLAQALAARGLTTAAVLAEGRNRSYADSFATRLGARLQALGGGAPRVVTYLADQHPDHAALAADLLSTHPAVVVLVCGPVDASMVSQQLRRRDPQVRIAASSWASNAQLLQMGGRAVEGALVVQVLDLDSQAPAYLEFRRRFEARFGNVPTQAAAFAYDATMMAAEALRRKGDGQSLRDVLRATASWPGLQQPLVLNGFGDSLVPFHVSEVRNGRFARVDR